MNKALKYILGFIILAALGFFALYISQNKNAASNIAVLHNLHGYAVQVTKNKDTIAKNDTVQFEFTVKQNGVPAKLLDKKIYPHAAIVSNDLKDIAFYHVDDLQILENDKYIFEHQFTQAGEYAIWIEMNDNATIEKHHGDFSEYIARMNVSVSGEAEAIAPARLTSQDDEYRLELIPDTMNVGSPSTFRIIVTREDGKKVKLIPDIDHFFYTANPEKNFYLLQHPDLPLIKDNEVVISNVTFPEHGQYAFWIRLFSDDGTGEVTSRIQGTFVLPKL